MVGDDDDDRGKRHDRKFRKSDRIVCQPDFDRVHQSDLFATDHLLVVKGTRNDLGKTRLGLSISKKVGNAVVRNRWKRAIREGFRLNRNEIPVGWDLVVRPRKGATLDRAGIANSLVQLSKRIDKFERRRKS